MVFSKLNIGKFKLEVGNRAIERLRKNMYFGFQLDNNSGLDDEIKSRIEIAENESIFLQPEHEPDYFISCPKCYVLSTSLYGVEKVRLKARTMARFDSFEMWLCRRILKKLWIERITNARVLKTINKDQELLTSINRKKNRRKTRFLM